MHDRALVVWLDADVQGDACDLGGKGSSLARLVGLGQPVPRTAVLTTAAYDAVASSAAVRELLARVCASAEQPDDEITDAAVDRVFLDVPLPYEVGRAIDELITGFDAQLAVRSSASAEDLGTSAFAGQYRSMLAVEPHDLERAVRLVWASLWHQAPRTYRRLRGVADADPTMAVVVMELVDPVLAGVLFTRDPVGDDEHVRLETVRGSGEALVSGAVTPDAHTWPRREAPVAAALALGPAAKEVVERGICLEGAWGAPLDIEFAVDGRDRLWIVQARPITTAPCGGAPRGGARTGADIAEMLPGVLPPLIDATAVRYVDAGFRDLLDALGADLSVVPAGRRFVRTIRSRAVVDDELLQQVTATVPGGALPRTAPSGTDRVPVAQIVRLLHRRRAAVLASEIVVQAADLLVEDDGRDGEHEPADLASLLARWERVQDLGARATAAEMEVAALATAAHEGVARVLHRHLDGGAERLAQELTVQPGAPAGPLDRCIRAGRVDPSQPITEDVWGAVLARSGSRSVFGGPTWADEPELAWMSYSTGPRTQGPGDRVRRADLALPRWRRRFVEREAADAAELLDRRERTKAALLDLGGIAHRLTAEIAARLTADGILGSAEEVWLLTPAELRDACTAGLAPDGLDRRRAALADDRQVEAATTAPATRDRGWPASPGRARGPAVVVDAPRSGAIRHGDVLVAHSTDAGWVPLFAHAAAIVVERGGPLCHAAIVARELGIPAVVNLPGIVQRVRATGPDVDLTVDGTTGAVAIHPRTTPAARVPPLAPVIAPPDDEPRLGVFVTGLIGASALFGVVVSVTEAVSSGRSVRRTQHRAAAPAEVVAEVVRHGTDAARSSRTGVPSRTWYGWLTALALLAGVLAGGVGVAEYVEEDDIAGRLVWLATALSVVPAAWFLAIVAHRARRRWPDVGPIARRVAPGPILRGTFGSVRQPTAARWWGEAPRPHRRWFAVFAGTAVTLLILNLFAPGLLRIVDEPLYDALGAPDPDPWGPDWFGMYFGRPQVVVPAAILVALFTVRCRVLAVAYPLTVAFGGLLNLGIGAAVGKHRPPLGVHAQQTDSFPSGHAVEVTLLLGLLPLAVAVLLRSRWAGRLVRVAASGTLIVMLVDGLREGSHWPSDHLGGFAIAMTAVVAVHALARMPVLHRTCTNCPALALHDELGPRSEEDP